MAGGENGMKGRRWIGILALLCCFYFFQAVARGQEKMAEKGSPPGAGAGIGFGFQGNRSPIDIASDTLEGNQKLGVVTFKGNVIAKQDETTLYSNLLLVTYDQETKKMKKIEGIGNVRIVSQERRATGQKVTFYQDENKVILEGDVVIREGDNVVRGERVTYFIDEERSVVEGPKGGRVSTTITPSKKE